ncbi:hypothetical protein [Winogradskyella rapida]|uniref:Bacterial repeat domain-containing protein n=1 Tax=Winogradskyella rapida TaxID=549701 RepID=A0ABW3KVX6_9FLAO
MIKKLILILSVYFSVLTLGYGQTEIFNITSYSNLPANWFGQNNITSNNIENGSGFILEKGNPSDQIETAIYNLEAYDSATFTVDMKKFSGGGQNKLLVEVSTDGGTSFTQSYTTPSTTGNYKTRTVSISEVSAQTVIRLKVNATNGADIQLKKLILQATGVATKTITVISSSGGTISPGTTQVNYNDSQSFTATANSCHTFDYWLVDDVQAGNNNPYTFTSVTDHHSLEAVYTQSSYTIYAAAGANGTINPSGSTTVFCGNNQTYNFTPDAGYMVSDVIIDSTSYGPLESYTFTDIASSHNISVTFAVYEGPCGYETFSNANLPNNYSDGNFTGDQGIEWTYLKSKSASGNEIDGSGITFYKNSELSIANVPGGIGDFSIQLKKAGSGSAERKIEVFVNGNSKGSYTLENNSNTQTFNIYNININGSISLEIKNQKNQSVVLDNIEWTCYDVCTPPNTPEGIIDGQTQGCPSTTTLSFSETAPNAVAYFWQTSATGESQSYNTTSNLNVTTPGDYYVRAYNTTEGCWSLEAVGPYHVDINATAPVINTHPSDITAPIGGTASFVVASNNAESYQWEVSTDNGNTWTTIGNYTNSLSIASVTLAHNNNLYRVEISNSCGSSTSDTATLTISETTLLNPGELIFVGFNGKINNNNANDEYLIANFADLTPGTEFSIVNSRFEAGAAAQQRTLKWGGASTDASEAPYEAKITYTGTTTIPAGSVLRLQVTESEAFISSVSVTEGNTTTTRTNDFEALITTPGHYPNLATNTSDQIFLMQGNFVYDGNTTPSEANYYFNGTVLHGLTTYTPWVSLQQACSSTTVESRIPPELYCFHIESTNSHSGYYQNSQEHGAATLRNLIYNISETALHWTFQTYNSFNPTSNAATHAGKTFTITPSQPAGQWVGDADSNWFNCLNWEGLSVPKASTNVRLDASAFNTPTIDYTAPHAEEHHATAYSKNLTLSGLSLTMQGNSNNTLEVHGDLNIISNGTLKMDDANPDSEDGTIILYGNWNNAIGTTGFEEGNSTVIFNGDSPQIIDYSDSSGLTSTETEHFYHVELSNNFTTATSNKLYTKGNLTINQGYTLTISNDDYIFVNDALINHGTFYIENNGSLIQDGNGTNLNSGNLFMERTAYDVHRLDYVYWSSPVENFNTNAISTAISSALIFAWNPTYSNSNGTQGNWVSAGNSIMTPGKGYILRGPNTHTTAQEFTALFSGSRPNNGNISVSVARGDFSGSNYTTSSGNTVTKYDDNWNLVGNPYPSAIDATTFLQTNTNLQGYINLWTHGSLPSANVSNPFYANFVSNYSTDDYITYNASGAVSGPDTFKGSIAAGQGFMVNLEDGNALETTIEFNNNMRSTTYNNTQFYRNASSTEKHRIWLDLEGPNSTTNRILVGYISGATQGKDRIYDAINSGTNQQNFYSLINDEAFNIQGRAVDFTTSDVVPLGFTAETSGSHTIAIHALDGLFETGNQAIYLKDQLLNITHNLLTQPYSFTSDSGTFNSRFELVYEDEFTLSINDLETTTNTVSIRELEHNNVQFKVEGTATFKSIEIIDLNGRRVYYFENNTSLAVYNLARLSKAPYIAKLELSNGQVLTKKAIKK